MERNTLTYIYHLQTGDRFYKVKDKNKTVLEKVGHDVKATKYQTYAHWAKEDNSRFPVAIKRDTEVIFLRHTTN